MTAYEPCSLLLSKFRLTVFLVTQSDAICIHLTICWHVASTCSCAVSRFTMTSVGGVMLMERRSTWLVYLRRLSLTFQSILDVMHLLLWPASLVSVGCSVCNVIVVFMGKWSLVFSTSQGRIAQPTVLFCNWSEMNTWSIYVRVEPLKYVIPCSLSRVSLYNGVDSRVKVR